MSIPELLKPHFEKPVGVFGRGVSGKAVIQVLERIGVPYVVYDKDVHSLECYDFTDEAAGRHSLVVYSPGFPIDHPWLGLAKRAGCLCLGELDFGALFWKGKIIAITGTNGKSTLTCFLAEALRNMGRVALACGNVGSPLTAQYECFDDEEAIAVCEVSSFQAETICYFSPDAVIWTTFDLDHLDRHPDMQSYFDAKWNLVRRLKTSDLFIGETVSEFVEKYGFELPRGVIVVGGSDINDSMLSEGLFSALPQGENYALGRAYWMSQGYDVEVLRKTGLSFQSLPYRLRKIGEVDGVGFWNDSKGSNFSATIAGLKGFSEAVFWIGGGKIKGGDLRGFVDRISSYIEEAFLIGEAGPILEERFKENGVVVWRYSTLELAIECAFKRALLSGRKREIVFSPGFSSFDMFRNAEDRGKFFEKKVLELKTVQNTLETIQGH